MTKACSVCKRQYQRHPRFSSAQWERSRYCSHDCSNVGRTTRVTVACAQCGGDKTVKAYMLRTRRNIFCSSACQGKFNDHGKTPAHERIRKSKAYGVWRKVVFIRDGYVCQSCGTKGVRLNADHIKPFSLYPDQRLSLENGRTLCTDCHKRTDTYGVRKNEKDQIAKRWEACFA